MVLAGAVAFGEVMVIKDKNKHKEVKYAKR